MQLQGEDERTVNDGFVFDCLYRLAVYLLKGGKGGFEFYLDCSELGKAYLMKGGNI